MMELKGTEKQIAWAKDIIEGYEASMNIIDDVKFMYDTHTEIEDCRRQQTMKAQLSHLQSLVDKLHPEADGYTRKASRQIQTDLKPEKDAIKARKAEVKAAGLDADTDKELQTLRDKMHSKKQQLQQAYVDAIKAEVTQAIDTQDEAKWWIDRR